MHAGETLGHYRIIETLGRGGMGEVYAAEDTKLHRKVALKLLPAVFASDPSFRQRFEREAQAVAVLDHPNIVTIHSVEEDAGRPFITMELVDGRPLSEAIGRGGMPLDRILRIAIEVADAMATAQQRGITHRNLKPANIVIAADGRARVLDFGLAKVRDAELAQAGDAVTRMLGELTGEEKILGTYAWQAGDSGRNRTRDRGSRRQQRAPLGDILFFQENSNCGTGPHSRPTARRSWRRCRTRSVTARRGSKRWTR